MGANVWFWLIWVLVLVFGTWGMNPWRPSPYSWGPFGGWFVTFLLVGILGLRVFGSPIH